MAAFPTQRLAFTDEVPAPLRAVACSDHCECESGTDGVVDLCRGSLAPFDSGSDIHWRRNGYPRIGNRRTWSAPFWGDSRTHRGTSPAQFIRGRPSVAAQPDGFVA